MRDLAIVALYLPLLAMALRRPFLAVLFYYFISIASLHALAFGFAQTMPWAYIAAGVALFAWLISEEKPQFVWNTTIALIIAWGLWIQVTSCFALNFAQGEQLWEKFMKIWVAALCFAMFFNTRERIVGIIAIIAGSIGFYGTKGGFQAFGGATGLLGPSSVSDRNDFGFACVIVLPLLWFLRSQVPKLWQRHAIAAVCALTLISALVTLSRGAFLALLVLGAAVWWKSHRKILALFAGAGVVVIVVAFVLPPEFYTRMSTIEEYQKDESAEGRLRAWQHAINVAMARPVIGGGLGTFRPVVYNVFTPEARPAEAHSIYFQVLGDHGFVGLALFLSILAVSSWNARWLQRRTRDRPDLQWANEFGFCSQLSLVAYASGGAFLSQAYLELYYVLIIAIAMARHVVEGSVGLAPAIISSDPAGAIRRHGPPAIPALGGSGLQSRTLGLPPNCSR